jgi:hypothetical protein
MLLPTLLRTRRVKKNASPPVGKGKNSLRVLPQKAPAFKRSGRTRREFLCFAEPGDKAAGSKNRTLYSSYRNKLLSSNYLTKKRPFDNIFTD